MTYQDQTSSSSQTILTEEQSSSSAACDLAVATTGPLSPTSWEEYSTRPQICLEIQRIIYNRIPLHLRRKYKRRHIISQALLLDSILYKTAPSMKVYADMSTLTVRVLGRARPLVRARHPSVFVRFRTIE